MEALAPSNTSAYNTTNDWFVLTNWALFPVKSCSERTEVTLRTESDQVPTHTVPVETNDDNSVTFRNWVYSSKAACFQAVTST